jgi:excinuclease ABC subunit C
MDLPVPGPDHADAPEGCGVYILLGRDGNPVYVGKSISIRKRLADHARAAAAGVEKEAAILAEATGAEYILTHNEVEALILENSLIKRHRPRYNVVLRDDKTYPYLRLDVRAEYPRLDVVRRVAEDGAAHFGPYVSARAMRRTLRTIASLFPLRTCQGESPPVRLRPCLNFEIGRCLGPCAARTTPEAYREVVDELVLFLRGRDRQLARRLEERMRTAAGALCFEEAARLRDRLREMEKFFRPQSMYGVPFPSADVVGQARGGAGWTVYVLQVRRGAVSGGDAHHLDHDRGAAEAEVLEAFLERYYSGPADIPAEIVVPFLPQGKDVLEEFLRERAGRKVTFWAATRGRGLDLLLLAGKNAQSAATRRRERTAVPAAALWERLGLRGIPRRIEVYDASTLMGSQTVVGMALWREGALDRKGHRRFIIRGEAALDDLASLRQAVGRRLARVAAGEFPAPDLLLVDGGAGQVAAAAAALERVGPGGIVVAGIAKGETRRGNDRVHLRDGGELDAPPEDPLVRFLGLLRDEAHRQAVTFHRERRSASMLRSTLDGIKGLGPRRRDILLQHFGTVEALSRATPEDLAALPGLPEEVRREIHRHFHP